MVAVTDFRFSSTFQLIGPWICRVAVVSVYNVYFETDKIVL